jgi:hypothetical protein
MYLCMIMIFMIKMCSPIINNKKYYYFCDFFNTEYYFSNEINNLQQTLFENITVYIPDNNIAILQRMFSKQCISTCKMSYHTDLHNILLYVDLEKLGFFIYDMFDKYDHKYNKNKRMTYVLTQLFCVPFTQNNNYKVFIDIIKKFIN